MIEIKLEFNPGTNDLCKLNKPFSELLRGSHHENYTYFRGGVSPYHDPLDNEPDWFKYTKFCADLKIVIAGRDEPLSTKEMFDFIIEHNRFAVTRDNLFMIWHLYAKEFKEYLEKTKKGLSIVAIAHPNLLPKHKNGPKIAPMLDIQYDNGKIMTNYDWSWIDGNMKINNFIFFKQEFLI